VTIRAPLAGTILQKSVEEGQVIQSASGSVSGGTTLMIMAALDRMQVRTLVDETDVGKISPGMDATVRVEAFPGRVFQGTVEKIEPQAVVQQNVTNFPVIVTLDNEEGLLKPGMNAEVQVLISERPRALLLPNSAVVNLQELGPAALVLGLDPETVQFDRAVFAELAAGLGGGAGVAGDREGATTAAAGAEGGRAARGLSPDSLRARVARGEIPQDSVRALMAARARAAGAAGPTGRAGRTQGSQPGQPTSAVSFVVKADGSLEARPILIGLNDWDNTEVLAGLEEGERVALLGAAQLQARRQEWLDRIRSGGGMFPGGGGMPRMR
jgi:HlyD family secretion protein